MSVGGIVVCVSVSGSEAFITTAEIACWKKSMPKLDLFNATAIRAEHGGHTITLGSTVWWQGPHVMFTPYEFKSMPEDQKVQGTHYDILLRRTGYSGSAPVLSVEPWLAEYVEHLCTESKTVKRPYGQEEM